jgi:hypothetical protein
LLARLLLYCPAECATPTNTSLSAGDLANAPPPLELFSTCFVLRNARALPLLPAALAFVSFGFVLVRVRVRLDAGMDLRAFSGGETRLGGLVLL